MQADFCPPAQSKTPKATNNTGNPTTVKQGIEASRQKEKAFFERFRTVKANLSGQVKDTDNSKGLSCR
jgi:hypothetical protein